jgi:hypothetical protein
MNKYLLHFIKECGLSYECSELAYFLHTINYKFCTKKEVPNNTITNVSDYHPFSIRSCRSCYARLYLCQRSFFKILVKVRNSKKNVLKIVLIIVNINKDENKSLISNQFSLKNDPPTHFLENYFAEVKIKKVKTITNHLQLKGSGSHKGNIAEVINNRGITVLPVINKIIETIIKNRTNHKILEIQNPIQRVFTDGSSPLNSAFPVEETYRTNADNKNECQLVLLDATSAFDVLLQSFD